MLSDGAKVTDRRQQQAALVSTEDQLVSSIARSEKRESIRSTGRTPPMSAIRACTSNRCVAGNQYCPSYSAFTYSAYATATVPVAAITIRDQSGSPAGLSFTNCPRIRQFSQLCA